MAELTGKVASVKVGGTPVSAAGEVLTRISDTVWQVDTASKQVLVDGVTVEWDDGGWTQVSYVSVNLLTGTFTFGGAGYAAGEDLRIKAGNYVPMSAVAMCHSYSLSKSASLREVPRFSDTHKRRVVGLKSASGNLSQWDIESEFFHDVLVAGNPVVIEFIPSGSSDLIRIWALLDRVEMQAAVDNPQDQRVSFQSTDYFSK